MVEPRPILRTIIPVPLIDKLDSLHRFDDILYFYYIWASVEAYLKAVGTGFTQVLNEDFGQVSRLILLSEE